MTSPTHPSPPTHWPLEFVPFITEAKSRYPHLKVLIDNSECFGHLWQDENGPCPDAGGCDLAYACQRVYVEHQAPRDVPDAPLPTEVSEPSDIAAPVAPQQRKKPGGRKKKATSLRGKWKNTGKYQRLGYQPAGRPVDLALEHFILKLGSPPSLPKVWNPRHYADKFGSLGRLTLSCTASYTSVLVDGATVARFWTNSATCAIIDIVPELVKVVSGIAGAGHIMPVPSGSLKKLKPCTHRFEIMFGATLHHVLLTTLAEWIRMAFLGVEA